MKLIITEKRSVATDIGRVIGCTELKDGYLEGSGYRITWAVGHLVGLADPTEYSEHYKSWSLETLPIIPDQFIYLVDKDPGKQKQFKTIKSLLLDSSTDEIICATDAGREGEAIFRYIYNASGCSKKFKRLWISSLTDESISNGLKHLYDGDMFDNLYYSAKARNEADWVVGINATRALTKSCNAQKPLSIGRVQTPTLSLICNAYNAHNSYVKKSVYRPDILLSCEIYASYTGAYFETKKLAEEFVNSLSKKVILAEKRISKKTEKPPLPFDLTSLQAAANRKFGFKAQETLDIAQSLYEKYKLTSYPRTSSRHLGDDQKNDIINKREILSNIYPEYQEFLSAPISSFCFNSSKLTDHHAIIPTFQNLEKVRYLDQREKKLFDLIAKQFITAMLPVCKKERLEYTFETSGHEFTTAGTTITDPGWRAINIKTKENDDDDDDDICTLPDLRKGSSYEITGLDICEIVNKRPALLTEATLLEAMETAGRLVESTEAREAMKDCGLGTPATRAAVIEILYKREYIGLDKNGKSILPTRLGLEIFDAVKDNIISNATFTGEWELKLSSMAKGEYAFTEFSFDSVEFVKSLIPQLIQLGKSVSAQKGKLDLKCPLCGGEIRTYSNAFGCSNYKQEEGCKFIISKNIFGVTLSDTDLSDLLKKGTTKLFTFKKDDKTFKSQLIFKDERLQFFTPSHGKCPKCSSEIKDNNATFYCNNKECKFVIFKTIAGKQIKESHIKELLKNRQTKLIEGFISKAGKTFSAYLKLDNEHKVIFEFPKK